MHCETRAAGSCRRDAERRVSASHSNGARARVLLHQMPLVCTSGASIAQWVAHCVVGCSTHALA